ncbi:hypothetical protein IWQ60_004389 [Tieghemiomyces parasiticus]|uniref:Fungal lipase-type domain-containing protein n=1 Tax=Tieghemiomyces parasiticus TaxID=78921 RepID=A0A9W8A8Z1_9FUNG|nr:hypothetical protein IWQ60_004389 [Tieghemiomyces parasiticus]
MLKVYAVFCGISYAQLESFGPGYMIFTGTQLIHYFECSRRYTVGYVAVNHSIKQVILAFRGTDSHQQRITDAHFRRVRWPKEIKKCKVHHGFHMSYHDVADQLYQTTMEKLQRHPNYTLAITGHSLGGALASLAAVDFAMRRPALVERMKVVTFGKPRVGNKSYVRHYNSLQIETARVVNKYDVVPHLPPRVIGYKQEGGDIWIKPHPRYHHETVAYPQVDNKSNPKGPKGILPFKFSSKDHVWAWNVPL